MSIDLLERAAVALGDLADEVVFVGGATVTLWITDPAAPPPRPTKDVDVIVEVATRSGYYAFEDRLRAIGFRNDERVICRWHHPAPPLVLDAMPTDATLLGFSNEWQRRAFPHATVVELPSAARIKAVPPHSSWRRSSRRTWAEETATSWQAATGPTSWPWSMDARSSATKSAKRPLS